MPLLPRLACATWAAARLAGAIQSMSADAAQRPSQGSEKLVAQHLDGELLRSSQQLLEQVELLAPGPFVHIPKTGGTWAGGQLKQFGISPVHIRGWQCSPQILCSDEHVPIRLASQRGCYEKEAAQELVAVVRHPYARAVSQWSWGLSMWKTMSYDATPDGMNRFIQDSLRNGSQAYRDDCRSPVQGRSVPRIDCGPWIQDCHWMPQTEYIYDAGYSERLVTTVLRQSNLSAGLQKVLRDGGFPAEFPPTHKAGSKKWLCALSTKSKKALDKYYSKDFELLGDFFSDEEWNPTDCS